jgi:hypothetical protein
MKLLQVTSLLHIIPFLQTFILDQNVPSVPTFKYGLGLTIVSSVLHHHRFEAHTLRNTMKIIDMGVAHYMVVYHLWIGMICPILTWKVITMYAAVAYCACVYWIMHLSNNQTRSGYYWHATIHLATSMGSYALLCESSCF